MKQYKLVVIASLIILGVSFYWYELRPAQIRKECKDYVISSGFSTISTIEREELGGEMIKINKAEQEKADYWYKDCLREKGLEK